ncbi:hypothetical protein HKBW3S09_01971 [Candidatus Hakubella thermalkaliphila]|uniref:Uncharacterized protein n=1 Tax=Candidatus Hakubella thermalkaliphila TaxID=2754717 RepID=A0A6V8NYK7_9ACTN|nr:hypothetical protein HKBW3S09_01971 [Candidatus Hakubella thermalkaliphila]
MVSMILRAPHRLAFILVREAASNDYHSIYAPFRFGAWLTFASAPAKVVNAHTLAEATEGERLCPLL